MEENKMDVIDEIVKIVLTGKISGTNKVAFAELLRKAMIERPNMLPEEAFRMLIKKVNNRMERYDLRVMKLNVGFMMSGAPYDTWSMDIRLMDTYKEFMRDWLQVGFSTPSRR